MSRILVTNDDGIDSPALAPLIRHLRALPDVEGVDVLVPDRERSWIGKAISRFEEIEVVQRELAGQPICLASGTPADCVNLGIHSVFEVPPDLVVSGVNLGLNFGRAYVLSSGTVGAAAEASIAGVPAVALSLGPPQHDEEWSVRALSASAASTWERAAAIGARIAKALLGDPARSDEDEGPAEAPDLLNVNIPESAGPGTPIEFTQLLATRYSGLFTANSGGRYAHDFAGWLQSGEATQGSDREALERGVVSITPLQLARTSAPADTLRRRLENAS